jgi:NAD(P)-dependent dehydrogenase (short-subunit alcohol dehydrogenase family)
LGKDAITIKADVTKMAELDQLFSTVREKHGHIDILFVNAGVAKLAPLESTSEEVFDEILVLQRQFLKLSEPPLEV